MSQWEEDAGLAGEGYADRAEFEAKIARLEAIGMKIHRVPGQETILEDGARVFFALATTPDPVSIAELVRPDRPGHPNEWRELTL